MIKAQKYGNCSSIEHTYSKISPLKEAYEIKHDKDNTDRI